MPTICSRLRPDARPSPGLDDREAFADRRAREPVIERHEAKAIWLTFGCRQCGRELEWIGCS